MRVSVKSGAATALRCDLWVHLFCRGEKPEVPRGFEESMAAAKKAGDLPASFGASCMLYPSGRAGQKRVLLLCAGKRSDLDEDKMRRLAAKVVTRAEALGVAGPVLVPSAGCLRALSEERLGLLIGEGAVLGAYRYVPPSKEKPKAPKCRSLSVAVLSGRSSRKLSASVKRGVLRGEAVCFARDLGNKPGNEMTPSALAREARKLAGPRLRVKVLGEADMKRLRMGALLGVSRGSREPAKLILLDWNPPGAKKTVCVVGKGLTFDAGGISLKPGAGMDEMRYDMCGSAAVLGLFHGIASGALKPACRVVGVVPSSENLPDGDAQKPGDIVRACDGTTIEVLNTDAEGRLILADALAYARKTYKPDTIVDLATLTGAVILALGHEMSAVMGNDQKLCDAIKAAGERSGDRVWQLPLWEIHREQMKSKFADIKNINKGRAEGAGSTSGGAFLSYFVGDTPWAHLDIAGSAWGAKQNEYYKGGATGVGVRLLLDWLERG